MADSAIDTNDDEQPIKIEVRKDRESTLSRHAKDLEGVGNFKC